MSFVRTAAVVIGLAACAAGSVAYVAAIRDFLHRVDAKGSNR